VSLDYERQTPVKTPEWIELAGWRPSRPNLNLKAVSEQVRLAPSE
jgi:hypothetical protein